MTARKRTRHFFLNTSTAFQASSGGACSYSSPRSVVIPSEVEEWSEWDERHERLRREGSGERVGRRRSSIDRENSKRCLDFARHDIKWLPNVLFIILGALLFWC